MKHFRLSVFAFLALFLIACPGEIVNPDNGDDSKYKTDLLKEKIENIISADIIDQAKALGMPIFDGISPPTIVGSYILDAQTMKKSSIEGDDPAGTKYSDEIITISNQNNDIFTASVKVDIGDDSRFYSAIISGSGDNFTLYIPLITILSDKTSAKAVKIYSGTLSNGDLRSFHYGMFLTEDPYVGLGHIIYEADGVAKNSSGDDPAGEDVGDGEDIIVAEGETAKGNYSGSDLTMQFPSKLKVSIKASNNQGADHGEVTVSEYSEFPMMELGDNIVLDFSETASVYTVDVETFIAKGLDAEEDIDCSLFTIDKQAVEASNGRIYKSVDFTYDKETGKLTFSTKVNTPFSETKASGGKFTHLGIYIMPHYSVGVEEYSMKAPYMGQLGNTCWAACAMMFIRSYTNLAPKMENSYLSFVKKVGHKHFDQGWNINFITFWKYDTDNIVGEIERMIGGGIKVSSASFRRTKSAANEMVKLIKQRKPVMLNYGDHVLYVIGYKRTSAGGPISFLVHDPQGQSGDMYKWIVWDDFLKAVGFKERLLLGDSIIIIYADRPMLSDPILQTMSDMAADNISPGIYPSNNADFTFSMQAYDKGRQVFPQFDVNELYGIRWGKLGYDEKNLSNDTIYSPLTLKIGLIIYNADNRDVPIIADMDLSAKGVHKLYSASITCPPGGYYTIKGDQFKETNGKVFDPTLSEFFKAPGNPDLFMSFSFCLARGSYENIDKFEYPALVIKSNTIEEPEEFKALRPILKDIYTSVTGKQWSEDFVWLEEAPGDWPYFIHTKDGDAFKILLSFDFDFSDPRFNITLSDHADYRGNIKVGNHPLPNDWTWRLNTRGKFKEVEIINDSFVNYFLNNPPGSNSNYLQRLTIASSQQCYVNLYGSIEDTENKLYLDFKNTYIESIIIEGLKNVVVESAGKIEHIGAGTENGLLTFSKDFEIDAITIGAINHKIVGSGNKINNRVYFQAVASEEPGKITLSNLDCSEVRNSQHETSLRDIEIENFPNDLIDIDVFYQSYAEEYIAETITVKNCPNLLDLRLVGYFVTDVNVIDCPNLKSFYAMSCRQLGGSFDQWPLFLQEIYNSGKSFKYNVPWRYNYIPECDENGENCKYVMTDDNGYGFYFDSSEPGSVDISKYNKVDKFDYFKTSLKQQLE